MSGHPRGSVIYKIFRNIASECNVRWIELLCQQAELFSLPKRELLKVLLDARYHMNSTNLNPYIYMWFQLCKKYKKSLNSIREFSLEVDDHLIRKF